MTTPDTTTTADPQTPGQDTGTPTTDATGQDTGQDPTTPETGTGEGDQTDRAEQELRKARDEAASRRVALREAEAEKQQLKEQLEKATQLQDKLAKLFGGDDGDSQDPQALLDKANAEREQAMKSQSEWQTKYNALVAENTLVQAVTGANGDATLAVQFIKGTEAFQNLDPEAEDYAEKVTTLVQETITQFPKLAAGPQVPTRSGSAPNPTPAEAGKLTKEDLRQLADKGQWEQINQAVRDGRV